MVSASMDSQAEESTRSTIAGGFVLVPVSSLIAAWRACRSGPLGIGEFRAWLAAHEMVARRCKLDDGRRATYGVPEPAGLLGVTRKTAGASLKRPRAAGLMGWSSDQNPRRVVAVKRLGSSAGVIPARQRVALTGSYRGGGGGDSAPRPSMSGVG